MVTGGGSDRVVDDSAYLFGRRGLRKGRGYCHTKTQPSSRYRIMPAKQPKIEQNQNNQCYEQSFYIVFHRNFEKLQQKLSKCF